jgi:addiction module HigA family antidote
VISEITQGKRSITADTAFRLGRYFGMEAQIWLNLQSRYDLLKVKYELDKRLDKEVTPHAA